MQFKSQVKLPFGSGEKAKYRFPIGTILAIFDLQVTAMLPTKFQINWLFGPGEETHLSDKYKTKTKNLTGLQSDPIQHICCMDVALYLRKIKYCLSQTKNQNIVYCNYDWHFKS